MSGLTVEVKPKEIYLGEVVQYHLLIHASSDTMVAPLVLPKPWGEFEVLEYKPSQAGVSGTDFEANLLITTYSTGTQTIPPLEIKLSRPNGPQVSEQTDEIKINV